MDVPGTRLQVILYSVTGKFSSFKKGVQIEEMVIVYGLYCKITVFVWGKVTILKFVRNTKQKSIKRKRM